MLVETPMTLYSFSDLRGTHRAYVRSSARSDHRIIEYANLRAMYEALLKALGRCETDRADE
jgi:hypothetical protein